MSIDWKKTTQKSWFAKVSKVTNVDGRDTLKYIEG